MEIVFELLSRVEHVRLADDILRPKPTDMTDVIARMQTQPSAASKQQAAANASGGKSAMVRMDKAWSGEKTRNVDLLGSTRISINFDSASTQSAQNGSAASKQIK